MDGIPYADIVILALIAGFIILRLRSVLGQKTGNDNPQFFNRERSERDKEAPREREPVVRSHMKALKAAPADEADTYLLTLKDNAIASTIADMKKLDPSFSATSFMQGAKMAYEMVFDAFAKGEKKTLEMLLSDSLYQTFAREIDGRASAAHITENTLLSVKAREIVQASLIGTKAQLAVKFDSEQVSLVKDRAGTIIEGDVSDAHPMDDEWLFERDMTSKNPNWKIIET